MISEIDLKAKVSTLLSDLSRHANEQVYGNPKRMQRLKASAPHVLSELEKKWDRLGVLVDGFMSGRADWDWESLEADAVPITGGSVCWVQTESPPDIDTVMDAARDFFCALVLAANQ